jgi:ribosomal protein L14
LNLVDQKNSRTTRGRISYVANGIRMPVADNTGARMAKMIGVLGKKNTRVAVVGDIITAHVRESTPTAAVKKGEVVRAVVVRTAYPIRRSDGSSFASTAMPSSSLTKTTTRAAAVSSGQWLVSCAIRIS